MGQPANGNISKADMLKGRKGGRIWSNARFRDRIDAIIAHEWEESKTVDHVAALKAAPKTELPITGEARRILRAIELASRSAA